MRTRTLLRAVLALSVAALPCAPRAGAQELALELVASDLDDPIFAAAPPGDTERLFVAEHKSGLIRIVRDGAVLAQPFLDLSGEIGTGLEEYGLLSFAFHPGYASNGRFFVDYIDPEGDCHVAEYRVSANPDVAEPDEVQEIFFLAQPVPIHNVNCIGFGPDGMLYVATGDGGPGWDPSNRAQDKTLAYGKLLRLDVDLPPPFVPADNPFVGQPGLEERIWALGLRNVWRFSIDPLTGDVWMGDVGQNQREELSVLSGAGDGGDNFGWRCLEGTLCTGLGGCECDDGELVAPIHEYTQSSGRCAIIGGELYRGALMPDLHGTYFFADWCTSEVWSLRYDGRQVQGFTDRTAELDPPGPATLDEIASFGRDGRGEVLVLDRDGEIYRIVPGCDVGSYCVGAPNSVGSGATLSVSGTTSVAANDLVLEAGGLVPHQSGLFFYGPEPRQLAFGDGYLCVGTRGTGLLRLYPPLTASAQGETSRLLDLTQPPASAGVGRIEPGDTWYFQCWYRDAAAGGAGFNFSDALRATFCP